MSSNMLDCTARGLDDRPPMQRRSHLSLFLQGEWLDRELAGLNERAIRQGRRHIVTLRLSNIVHPGGLSTGAVQASCLQRDGICTHDLQLMALQTCRHGVEARSRYA